MPPRSRPPSDGMRIAFHLQREFHHAILDPVLAKLQTDFPCLISDDRCAIVDFRPRIVVMAHRGYAFFREHLPETLLVFVRHGFVSKNQMKPAMTGCDFACVSSEWLRDTLIEQGCRPRLGYWVTGFVPMDGVLGHPRRIPLPPGFEKGTATLLYAPTFNETLSSTEVLGDRWIDTLRQTVPDLNVIIKPHPHIPKLHPEWMNRWRRVAARLDRVLLVEDTDDNVYDYFPSVDVLLSDTSSVIFYFLAMDRPIVLVTNPRRFEDPACLDEEGPEWAWRDMGVEIDTVDQLPAAVTRSLSHPSANAERRALYKTYVFGSLLDGRAADRLAGRLRALAQPTPVDREWVDLAWNSVITRGQEMHALRQTLTFRIGAYVNRHLHAASTLKQAARGMLRRTPTPRTRLRP